MATLFQCRSGSIQRQLGLLGGKALVPLLGNGQLDTLALGQRDVRLVALAWKENINITNIKSNFFI